ACKRFPGSASFSRSTSEGTSSSLRFEVLIEFTSCAGASRVVLTSNIVLFLRRLRQRRDIVEIFRGRLPPDRRAGSVTWGSRAAQGLVGERNPRSRSVRRLLQRAGRRGCRTGRGRGGSTRCGRRRQQRRGLRSFARRQLP